MKKKVAWIVGIAVVLLALLITAGVLFTINQGTTEADPTPSAEVSQSPTGESTKLDEDQSEYKNDFVSGSPWYLSEGYDGENSYSNATMIALSDDGHAWAYVFGQHDSMPPAKSEMLYLGSGYDREYFGHSDLDNMERTSGPMTYFLVRDWIDAPTGYDWADLEFTPTDQSIERLRGEPWYGYIKDKWSIDLNDEWWSDKSLSESVTISCPSGDVEGTVVLKSEHTWHINGVNVPESTLLRDGCTL